MHYGASKYTAYNIFSVLILFEYLQNTKKGEVWEMIDQSLELESDELILRLEAAEEAMKSIDQLKNKLARVTNQ